MIFIFFIYLKIISYTNINLKAKLFRCIKNNYFDTFIGDIEFSLPQLCIN
jgi:hypothetical protein